MAPGGWHRRSGEPGDDSETPESVDAYGGGRNLWKRSGI